MSSTLVFSSFFCFLRFEPAIVRNNLDVIIQHALANSETVDCVKVTNACLALTKLVPVSRVSYRRVSFLSCLFGPMYSHLNCNVNNGKSSLVSVVCLVQVRPISTFTKFKCVFVGSLVFFSTAPKWCYPALHCTCVYMACTHTAHLGSECILHASWNDGNAQTWRLPRLGNAGRD